MTGFLEITDPYTLPGSTVLVNRLGLTDQQELEQAERLYVNARLLDAHSVPQTFDYVHFRALHFHMFQDVYPWAGQERTVFMKKNTSVFAHPIHIGHMAVRTFAELRDSLLKNRSGMYGLAEILGHFINEMNALHPFREGNGRHLRAFLQQLVENMGCTLDATALDRDRWIDAAIVGLDGDERPMAKLVAEIVISPSRPRGFRLPAALSPDARKRICASLKRSGYPPDIVREYRITLHC